MDTFFLIIKKLGIKNEWLNQVILSRPSDADEVVVSFSPLQYSGFGGLVDVFLACVKSGCLGCRWGFPAGRPAPNCYSSAAFCCFSRAGVAVVAVAAAGGGVVVLAAGQRPIGRP